MTPERRRTLAYVAGALLLIAVALLAFRVYSVQHQKDTTPRTSSSSSGLPGSGAVATSTAESPTATPDASGTSKPAKPSQALTAAEAAAIRAELAAIERALDSMSMPSDSDFKDIETGLK